MFNIIGAFSIISLTFLGSNFGEVMSYYKNQNIAIDGVHHTKNVLVYDDVTYLPVRDLANLLDINIDYKDGVIYLGETPTSQTTFVYITPQEAVNIALSYAGISHNENFSITKQQLDLNDTYNIEFIYSNKQYIYQIDKFSGQVVNSDSNEIPQASPITQIIAEDLAFSHANVDSSKIRQLQTILDELVYKIDFKVGNILYQYEVDAYSSEILKSDRSFDTN